MMAVALLRQYAKAYMLMEVTDGGVVMAVALEQAPKACLPMEVTDLGIAMAVALEQPLTALLPMEVTDPGVVMAVALVQPPKALLADGGDGFRDKDGGGRAKALKCLLAHGWRRAGGPAAPSARSSDDESEKFLPLLGPHGPRGRNSIQPSLVFGPVGRY